MQQVTTTLRQVATFSGTSARGPWLKTVFTDEQGVEYATFKGEVASVANQLLNVPVVVSFTEKQNGQYTNRTLEAVTPTAGATPSPSPAQAAAPAYTPSPAVTTEPDRQLRIMRQSALERAIMSFVADGEPILTNLTGLYQLAGEFIDFFENGYQG